ncbi:putative amino acid transporter [Caenibius tardaugens NBRC 16725]|uniref:Putative amino acid transporter n=1 Tax=Caenibius tardaugens NBRC 16725 TaxID=1219035 RepID=U2YHU9_9SPHN|nr:amino acid permease [Caenibius tardaugens]AZI37212.1 amino acid permease [Caenibius tardaugens NBRC 16725]GAD47542.1 putative amino acid transporter [Caenibius tardaugens NBRC 16725]
MSLQAGSIGWRQIAGLGVGLVVAGQFAGWNYGLAQASWANMMAATVLVSVLCFGMALCVAELATMLPNAGGLYVYCEAVFGRFAGYAVGVATFTALAVSTGAAAQFISAYSEAVTGFGGPLFKAILFAVIIGIHIIGVGEALTVLLGAGLIAVLSLLAFGGAMLPHFNVQNLLPAGGAPVSATGIISCVPFAIMMFICVEQTATSAEEARNPKHDVPLGILIAIGILALTATCVLVLGPAAAGSAQMGQADDPLTAALATLPGGGTSWMLSLIGAGAILGLVATLFSMIYGASRQMFALARGGYLPSILARQSKNGIPVIALCVVGVIGFPLSYVSPDKIILTMVMLLTASYIVTLAAFIKLRIQEPDRERPFRAPGGVVTAGIALLLSALVVVACLRQNPDAIVPMLIVLGIATIWFFVGAKPQPSPA